MTERVLLVSLIALISYLTFIDKAVMAAVSRKKERAASSLSVENLLLDMGWGRRWWPTPFAARVEGSPEGGQGTAGDTGAPGAGGVRGPDVPCSVPCPSLQMFESNRVKFYMQTEVSELREQEGKVRCGQGLPAIPFIVGVLPSNLS